MWVEVYSAPEIDCSPLPFPSPVVPSRKHMALILVGDETLSAPARLKIMTSYNEIFVEENLKQRPGQRLLCWTMMEIG